MRLIDDARICLIFFTRIPVSWPEDLPRERITRAFQAVPIVGLVIGLIGALAYWGAFSAFAGDLHIAATIAVAAQVFATGAFHEDGFTDFFDGLGGGQTRAAKLEIMRDSRIGTYGSAALFLVLLLKIFLLSSIAHPLIVGLSLIISGTLARVALVHVMTLIKPAAEDGASAEAGQPTKFEATTATIMGAVIAGVCAIAAFQLAVIMPALGAVVGAGVGAAIVGFAASKQLGGQTGDALGASAVAAEIGALAGLVALMPAIGV
jgi:adenosylcobinamide-GDP ribazoletransferase